MSWASSSSRRTALMKWASWCVCFTNLVIRQPSERSTRLRNVSRTHSPIPGRSNNGGTIAKSRIAMWFLVVKMNIVDRVWRERDVLKSQGHRCHSELCARLGWSKYKACRGHQPQKLERKPSESRGAALM
jgi:hypothetical protein